MVNSSCYSAVATTASILQESHSLSWEKWRGPLGTYWGGQTKSLNPGTQPSPLYYFWPQQDTVCSPLRERELRITDTKNIYHLIQRPVEQTWLTDMFCLVLYSVSKDLELIANILNNDLSSKIPDV